MPLASRALLLGLAGLLLASPVSAAITDPQLSCADYLKTRPGSTHKAATGGKASADVEARIRSFCAANPKMKAMDAEMTVTGD